MLYCEETHYSEKQIYLNVFTNQFGLPQIYASVDLFSKDTFLHTQYVRNKLIVGILMKLCIFVLGVSMTPRVITWSFPTLTSNWRIVRWTASVVQKKNTRRKPSIRTVTSSGSRSNLMTYMTQLDSRLSISLENMPVSNYWITWHVYYNIILNKFSSISHKTKIGERFLYTIHDILGAFPSVDVQS